MNLTRNLLIAVVLVLLAALVVQEISSQIRFERLRHQQAAAAADAATTAALARTTAAESQEAVRQMSRAREELAAAQHRLARATEQIQQMQGQAQITTSTRRLGSPPAADISVGDGPNYNPTLDGLLSSRSWGEEQATGAPNTFEAGDKSTAWAPQQQNGGEEWLHLTYAIPVPLAEVRVRETYNPGAVSKVAAVLPNGQEVVIWEGFEEPATAPVDRVFPVAGSVTAGGVRVYLDTRRVNGWNEIDAVELVGRDGSRQWAATATASSSFAGLRSSVSGR